MCGIVGYVGTKEALPVLLRSLHRVTYRGYDSFGVATLNGHGIETYRQTGSVDQSQGSLPRLAGTMGIGHTRWATVGNVSESNAHPHLGCTGEVAVVHNGDIDNFRELRAQLEGAGHGFRSETDSEVIAHLVESYYCGNIVAAVRRATNQLQGSYAVAVLHQPTRSLMVARNRSPLVVGFGNEEYFVASDAPGLLPYTRRVAYLEDGDIGLVGTGGLTVWHGGNEVERSVHSIEWDAEALDCDGFPHFMLKEIHEQPKAVQSTLATTALDGSATTSIRLPVERPREILLLGCGTSYHSALLGERFLEQVLPIPVRARVASEFDSHGRQVFDSLAIALTQSGETADTLAGLREARSCGYRSVAVTNVQGSSITREADEVFLTKAGPEVAVAATKSFTAQLAAVYALAVAIVEAHGQRVPDRVREAFCELPMALQRCLERTDEVQRAASALAGYEDLFIIAKGTYVPVAMEGALKFKEVAYQHTEGCPAGELKHGPFALLGPKTPVIAIVGADEHRTRMLTAMREVRSRASLVVALTEEGDRQVDGLADFVLRVPQADPVVGPALYTVLLQLLSYYSARERGCEIDRPRNLAKSVTVH